MLNINPKAVLLIPEPPHMFSSSLAMAIGLNSAIFLQQLQYWLMHPCTQKNEIEGHIWVYNTIPQWHKQFPFWSVRTLERVIEDLEKKHILISIKPHKKESKHKKWYRIDYLLVQNCDKKGLSITPEWRDHDNAILADSSYTAENNFTENNIENEFSIKKEKFIKSNSQEGIKIKGEVKNKENKNKEIDEEKIKIKESKKLIPKKTGKISDVLNKYQGEGTFEENLEGYKSLPYQNKKGYLLWVQAVAHFYPEMGMQPKLAIKDKKCLDAIITRVENKSIRYTAIVKLVRDWKEFCEIAKTNQGAFNCPVFPTISFASGYMQSAVSFAVSYENKKSISTPAKESKEVVIHPPGSDW